MTNQNILQRAKGSGLSRRGFLAAATASMGSLALAGCSPAAQENTLAETGEAPEILEGGEWVPLPCAPSCGGRCVTRGYLVDGVIVRQKTDDFIEDTAENPQYRCCPRGRGSRQLYMGADRLRYPMKRKHWQPGGKDFHGELRGIDEWERISWDEALDLIASELKRIKENYGPEAFFCGISGDGRGGGMGTGGGVTRLLNAFGGCVYVWGTQSYGGMPIVGNTMQGEPWFFGATDTQDEFSMAKAKRVICFGMGNVTWNNWMYVKHAGVEIIVVDPICSPAAQALADRWIPVRPGTDGALLLGMAYHMIENNLHDQEFLDTYVSGFDADHMPEGSDPKDNFKDYVLGTYDGQPKTPAWASEICGVPEADIMWLAEQATSVSPLVMRSTLGPARTDNGQNYAQIFLAVGWMTGNVGIPGGEVSMSHPAMMGSKAMAQSGQNGIVVPKNPICEDPAESAALPFGGYDPSKFYGLPYGHAWDAIINGKVIDFVHGERDIDIRCIWKVGTFAPLNQISGGMKGIEAFRKVEFVVSSDLLMSSDCLYSDIVLPCASLWEAEGGSAAQAIGDGLLIYYGNKVMDPIYEAKDDLWVEAELAKRLGLDPKEVVNVEWKQACFNRVAGTQVMKEDYSDYEPLVSITQDDIDELGVEGQPQDGKIPYKEFVKTGYYRCERSQNDPFVFTPRSGFRADPVGNPLGTPSGKLEIYCPSLVDYMKLYGTEPLVEATPKYRPAKEGYEDTFANWDAKEKGEYPFQMVSTHHMRSMHSFYNNVKWICEAFANNLFLNVLDAQKLGVSQDETVLISSQHGKMLRRVNVTPRIMPGVVLMGEGNHFDVDEEGIDRGGNANALAGGHLIAAGHQPWNTVMVKIEKWDGDPLQPDCVKPARIYDFE
ncbi:molybdopterin-dependent oxidoreductase [Adlercreutzia sp. R25]|uniref:Molybdopterin-dependent oxidoreductase n=1 Tax=Adlercreutzia shanghongiae TaxID=3111773 RepID=A0ABU6IXJ6_9ACTN|nr:MULTISPECIES: molybdopterin-dependent oxidoreductase [unclassified Adlercreutzia]MEC4272528.1 molybdopterin-dependent oxidoreductase [Adlercreutzia sp. R25]MEC4294572.1 molybdopterin-dependent oxidoreductase [Adlercreutzia sp. R22]